MLQLLKRTYNLIISQTEASPTKANISSNADEPHEKVDLPTLPTDKTKREINIAAHKGVLIHVDKLFTWHLV
jgi:hypothetical protein